MKIAINLTRESVGGITSSNINLINHLYGLDHHFAGIELTARMYMKGSALFRNFAPEVFDHHIINIHHLPIMSILKNSKTIKDVETAYREPLQIIKNILQEVKPDVVLLSGTYYIPWLISIAAKQARIPMVLWYSGVLTRETESQPDHLKKLFLAMEKSIVARARRTIFPSRLCKNVAEKEVTKHTIKNSYVIPNPVASIFTDPCAGDYSLERRIAAVGRYSKVKNFDAFFVLHKELLRRKWRHNACFVTNPDTHIKKLP